MEVKSVCSWFLCEDKKSVVLNKVLGLFKKLILKGGLNVNFMEWYYRLKFLILVVFGFVSVCLGI